MNKQQIVQLVQAAMQGDQRSTQYIQQIMQAAQQGDPEAVQVAQMIQQVAQQMQQQQVRAARFGAKLNYIRQLKGVCPEGYEMQYYKSGGQICKRCMKKHEEGGQANPMNLKEQFNIESAKCGKKMKKKACGGSVDKCGSKMDKAACGKRLKKKEDGGEIQSEKCGGKTKKKVNKAEGGVDTSTFLGRLINKITGPKQEDTTLIVEPRIRNGFVWEGTDSTIMYPGGSMTKFPSNNYEIRESVIDPFHPDNAEDTSYIAIAGNEDANKRWEELKKQVTKVERRPYKADRKANGGSFIPFSEQGSKVTVSWPATKNNDGYVYTESGSILPDIGRSWTLESITGPNDTYINRNIWRGGGIPNDTMINIKDNAGREQYYINGDPGFRIANDRAFKNAKINTKK